MRGMCVRPILSMLLLPLCFHSSWAASPPSENSPLAIFRTEVAEVHVALAAYDKRNAPVTTLSPSDLTVQLDGRPLNQPVLLERRHGSPISATVMTDVSDSMSKADFIARDTWQWLITNYLRSQDHVTFLDFGAELAPEKPDRARSMHLTSLYDCVMEVLPFVGRNATGQKALILFTDGQDNMSMHGLPDVIRRAQMLNVTIYAVTTYKYKIWYNEYVLNSLTHNTGGRLFVIKNTKEMIGAVQEIGDELRNGYELVFRADNVRSGLHRIAIEPSRGQLTFFHRDAYFQPPEATSHPRLIASGPVQ